MKEPDSHYVRLKMHSAVVLIIKQSYLLLLNAMVYDISLVSIRWWCDGVTHSDNSGHTSTWSLILLPHHTVTGRKWNMNTGDVTHELAHHLDTTVATVEETVSRICVTINQALLRDFPLASVISQIKIINSTQTVLQQCIHVLDSYLIPSKQKRNFFRIYHSDYHIKNYCLQIIRKWLDIFCFEGIFTQPWNRV